MFKTTIRSLCCPPRLRHVSRLTGVIATLALGAIAAPAFASSKFFLVVPLTAQSQTQEPVETITVSLAGAVLPKATINQAYSESLRPYLSVTGDAAFDIAAARWSMVAGALPAGLTLDPTTGVLSGTPTTSTATPANFSVRATYKGKDGQSAYSLEVDLNIEVSLAGATLHKATFNKAYNESLLTHLSITGDPSYDPAAARWSLAEGALPAGLALDATTGAVAGTPTASTTTPLSFKVQADYKGLSAIGSYQMEVMSAIQDFGTYRAWSDNQLANSCQDYRNPGAGYAYFGATGDGIYRVQPAGQPAINVYCDMTTDGGGWTLMMKQAKGDGNTLQGDSTYWTYGTVLNDTASNLNRSDANMVSSAFSSMVVTQYRLEASNESTRKFATRSASTPLVAFSDARRAIYADDVGALPAATNWFIHATTYPNGAPITVARFDFNFMERTVGDTTGTFSDGTDACGARWGWSANENSAGQAPGSADSCGGLGAYGVSYGGSFMANNKNVWQPATLYLWAK